jgi:hypothetical protein
MDWTNLCLLSSKEKNAFNITRKAIPGERKTYQQSTFSPFSARTWDHSSAEN